MFTKDNIMKHAALIVLGLMLTWLSSGIAGMIDPTVTSTILEFAAVAVSFTCTIMFMLQYRAAYFYGVVSTALLCALFVSQGVFALAIFNGVLTLSLIYGYFRWGQDGKAIDVSMIDVSGWVGYLSFFLIVWIVGGWMLVGVVSTTDLVLAAASATAQLMLDNKKWENWIVWIVINIFSIAFLWQQGLALMAVQFVFFTINAIVALYRWYGDMMKGVDNGLDSTGHS